MSITASMVKELRQKTGAGMMDCKKVLVEVNGDMDQAIKLMREKGIAKAAKKAGRVAAEGLVKICLDNNKAAIVEVNSETDFVSKNENFIKFVEDVAKQANKSKSLDIDAFMGEPWHLDSSKTVKEIQTEHIASIGENLNIRRFKTLDTDGKQAAEYIHANGKIGVLVIAKNAEGHEDAIKNIAMQVAAANPKYLNREDVPEDVINAEKDILKNKAINENKPEHVVDKIVMGGVNKMYGEICLLDQGYVKEDKMSVKQYLKSVSPELEIVEFVRFETGEGIEKKEENFAEEVAKQIAK